MPQARLPMRNIREALRLATGGLSNRPSTRDRVPARRAFQQPARLMDPRLTLSTIGPERIFLHPSPDSHRRKRQTMLLAQLLRGEGGAEVGIVCSQQSQSQILNLLRDRPITWLATNRDCEKLGGVSWP